MSTPHIEISVHGDLPNLDADQLAAEVRQMVGQVAEVDVYLRPQSPSDSELWATVNQRLAPLELQQLDQLMQQNKLGLLTGIEKEALDRLNDLVNQQMLERSEALVELQQRGYDIKGYLGVRS